MVAVKDYRVKVGFVMFHSKLHTFTGGPRVLVNLLSGINREKFFPIVLTNSEDSRMTKDLRSIGISTIIEPTGPVSSGGQIFEKGGIRKIKVLFEMLKYNFKALGHFKKNRIQVVWVRNVKILFFVGWAAKILRIPLVWDIGMEKESKGIMHYIHKLGFKWAEKVVAEAPIVFQQIFDQKLVETYWDKTLAINSAINQERIDAINGAYRKKTDSQSEMVKFLFTGTIIERKNPLFLVKGVKHLVDAGYKNFSLTLAGGEDQEPEYVEKVKAYVNTHQLNRYVRFLGWRNDVPELMITHNALVITSDNEGVPYTLLEAMYAEMAVLASDAGGIPDIIHHGRNGYLYQKGDMNDFLDKLKDLLGNTEVREKIGKKGHDYVTSNHVPWQWVENYEDLLLRIVKNQKRESA